MKRSAFEAEQNIENAVPQDGDQLDVDAPTVRIKTEKVVPNTRQEMRVQRIAEFETDERRVVLKSEGKFRLLII